MKRRWDASGSIQTNRRVSSSPSFRKRCSPPRGGVQLGLFGGERWLLPLPNTKLSDQGKGALLLDEPLAQAFASAVVPVLRKRHGEQVRLVIERWESSPTGAELARLLARARHDTSVVRARIREGNFAPNRPPLVLAADLA